MTLPEVVQRLRVNRTMLYRLMRKRQLVPITGVMCWQTSLNAAE
jgi:predicted DNA-binding transcriptional regulator AlpA